MKNLGADIVIDYKKDDFEKILHDYDVVLNSQDRETLEKSLRVLRPGGKLISISGPPDPEFAKEIGLSWMLRLAMTFLSYRAPEKAAVLRVKTSVPLSVSESFRGLLASIISQQFRNRNEPVSLLC